MMNPTFWRLGCRRCLELSLTLLRNPTLTNLVTCDV